MFNKIGNIVLIGRPSQYARGKCPESARPSLKTGREMEAVCVSQQRSCHRDSQRIGAVWFIADPVRDDDRRIPSRGGIDIPNHVVPRVSRSGWFGEAHKLESARRTKLIRKRAGESFSYT